MDSWEKYIHINVPDKLIQLAIVYAEFETLHPFLDSNVRLGRICVPLFMHKVGLIQSPMFYISAYFETHREEYYERLLAISRDDDWTGWCEFFLINIAGGEDIFKGTYICYKTYCGLYHTIFKPQIVL